MNHARETASHLVADTLGIAVEPTYFDLANQHVDPAEIAATARRIGANAIRVGVFSHQGHAYYPSAVAPEAPGLDGRDLLGEFEAACRREGIRLVVYLNSKWVSEEGRDEHPDWVVLQENGPASFRAHDPSVELNIHPMCPCSPFMEYYLSIVAEVVAVSSPDAIYVDNFAIVPFCRCPSCVERFGAPIPDRVPWQAAPPQRYLDWLVQESRRIARRIAAAARSRRADMPVVFNRGQFWSLYGTFSPEDNRLYAHDIADAIHAESAVRFYGESFTHINQQCAFGRSIDLPVWTWVEYAAYPFSYAPCPPAETKIKAAKVLANGGRPMVWNMACAPSGGLSGMDGIREVFELVRRHPECFKGVSFRKFAAILHSSENLRAVCRGDNAVLNAYRKNFTGAYDLALRNHLPFDFLLDDHVTLERLREYDVLILPNVGFLSPERSRAIERYVEQGGAVFATFETSLRNAAGERGEDFGLDRLFGAHFAGELGEQWEGYCAGYCRFLPEHPAALRDPDQDVLPVGGRYLAVRSSDAAAALLRRCRYYCDSLQAQTQHPAVVARRHGNGRVIYVPGEFFRFYHERGLPACREFFSRSLRWLVDNCLPVVTDLPDTVEVTLARTADGADVVHLVNCTFDGRRPVDYIPPIAGKRLRLRRPDPASEALDLTTNRPVRHDAADGQVVLDLPELTGYNVIVVR